VWGVGTRLVTAHDQPALGGVYKLAALRDADGRWQPRVKRSNSPLKTSFPGLQQVRRYTDPATGAYRGDVLYDERDGEPTAPEAVGRDADWHDVLRPVLRQGQPVGALADLATARAHCRAELDRLPAPHLGLVAAEPYPVHIEPRLAATRKALLDVATPEQT